MTAQPSVTLVCLTADRPQFEQRMLRSYLSQTYPNTQLLVFDSGRQQMVMPGNLSEDRCIHINASTFRGEPIGCLRNAANSLVKTDIIAHMDVDDWSHPRRIEEQVALLQSSGKQAVGYRELLFWDERPGQFCGAWLYTSEMQSYSCGTSLCYWRAVWQQHPFPALHTGEDLAWLAPTGKVKAVGVSSLMAGGTKIPDASIGHPRMIATIHGANTTAHINPALKEWRRVPEWDSYSRERLAL